MMNKKMGAEAWGAAELGSAAPMGAAAMGGGSESGDEWAVWLAETTFEAMGESETTASAVLEYGDYKVLGSQFVKIIFDGTEYISEMVISNDSNISYGDSGLTEFPFEITNLYDETKGKGLLFVKCLGSGEHTIEIYAEQLPTYVRYLDFTEFTSGEVNVVPNQDALPPAEVLYVVALGMSYFVTAQAGGRYVAGFGTLTLEMLLDRLTGKILPNWSVTPDRGESGIVAIFYPVFE